MVSKVNHSHVTHISQVDPDMLLALSRGRSFVAVATISTKDYACISTFESEPPTGETAIDVIYNLMPTTIIKKMQVLDFKDISSDQKMDTISSKSKLDIEQKLTNCERTLISQLLMRYPDLEEIDAISEYPSVKYKDDFTNKKSLCVARTVMIVVGWFKLNRDSHLIHDNDSEWNTDMIKTMSFECDQNCLTCPIEETCELGFEMDDEGDDDDRE